MLSLLSAWWVECYKTLLMKMYRLSYESQPLKVQLADDLVLSCPFHPSAYNGNGSEERQSIIIKSPESLYEAFAAIEARCRGLLKMEKVE